MNNPPSVLERALGGGFVVNVSRNGPGQYALAVNTVPTGSIGGRGKLGSGMTKGRFVVGNARNGMGAQQMQFVPPSAARSARDTCLKRCLDRWVAKGGSYWHGVPHCNQMCGHLSAGKGVGAIAGRRIGLGQMHTHEHSVYDPHFHPEYMPFQKLGAGAGLTKDRYGVGRRPPMAVGNTAWDGRWAAWGGPFPR